MTNYEKAVEVANNVYWVGQRDPNSLLQVNAYLRRFDGNGKTINLLVDPGPLEHFSTISRKVGSITQDIANVNMYSINHQDPDVGLNSTFIAKMNPRSVCLCSEDTWRLVRFFEIPKKNYRNVYSFENKATSLITDKTNHVLEFVPTPFCHFVGAYALYDRANRVLFTGDLFAGLNPPNNLGLFATEDHWEGIKMFHQIYMPSQTAIRRAIDNIRALNPAPEMIIPQHGAIIQKDMIEPMMNRLYHLETGIDMFNQPDKDAQIPQYEEVINTLFAKFIASAGLEEADLLFDFEDRTQELMIFMDLKPSGVQKIYSQPEVALHQFLRKVAHHHDSSLVNEIKSLAIKECLMHRLPMPIQNLYSTSDSTEADELQTDELLV